MFPVFDVATRNFKMTYVAHILFLLNNVVLDYIKLSQDCESNDIIFLDVSGYVNFKNSISPIYSENKCLQICTYQVLFFSFYS